MEIVSTQKFLLVSPRKVRPVADLVKKMKPADALNVLPFTHKRGADVISKVIKNAMAGLRAKGVSDGDMVFKEIQISEGPRLKRGNPVSRGQWHPIKRRMSHIRVVLTTSPKSQAINPKEIQNSKVKETKIIKKNIRKEKSPN